MLSFADQEEAEYAAHVAEHTNSSRDALVQVQQLLQQNQKEHIARFLETQTLYAQARQADANVRDLQQQTSKDFDLWDEDESNTMDDLLLSASQSIKSDPKRLIADTVRLEVEIKAQRAALDVAKQTYETLVQQIETSRRQKEDLDEKLELMRSFEQRQREILDQLDLMFQQNQEITAAMGARREELQRFVSENLQLKYEHKSGNAMETWLKLMSEELRSLSSSTLPLTNFDTAVKSVELTMDDHRNRGTATTRREVVMTVPFSDFYINQIQHERGSDDSTSTNGGGLNQRHQGANAGGLNQVLSAMRVPEYGSWDKMLTMLQQRDQNIQVASRMLHERLKMLALQPPDDQHATSNGSQVQALLSDVRSRTEEIHTRAFPALKEIVATNFNTVEKVLVRLHTAVDDWFEQRGFSVQLEEQTTS